MKAQTKESVKAWNNVNLVRLAEKIKSPLVLYVQMDTLLVLEATNMIVA